MNLGFDISSLWTVNEISTAFLMVKFYENLEDPQTCPTVAIALNRAQVWLRDATNRQLKEWLQEKKSIFRRTLGSVKWVELCKSFDREPDAQPCAPPFHWAAFCAIGRN